MSPTCAPPVAATSRARAPPERLNAHAVSAARWWGLTIVAQRALQSVRGRGGRGRNGPARATVPHAGHFDIRSRLAIHTTRGSSARRGPAPTPSSFQSQDQRVLTHLALASLGGVLGWAWPAARGVDDIPPRPCRPGGAPRDMAVMSLGHARTGAISAALVTLPAGPTTGVSLTASSSMTGRPLLARRGDTASGAGDTACW